MWTLCDRAGKARPGGHVTVNILIGPHGESPWRPLAGGTLNVSSSSQSQLHFQYKHAWCTAHTHTHTRVREQHDGGGADKRDISCTRMDKVVHMRARALLMSCAQF